MKNIENIWKDGHSDMGNTMGDIESFSLEEAITRGSNSINRKMMKSVLAALVLTLLSIAGYIYNIGPYSANRPVVTTIIIISLLSLTIVSYLCVVLAKMKRDVEVGEDLHSVLLRRLKFFETHFQLVTFIFAFSIVTTTFAINLAIESGDGIIESRKILILSIYYLFCFAGAIVLMRTIHGVDKKQLQTALQNLEERKITSLDEQLKINRTILRWILIGTSLLAFIGIAVYFMVAQG